MDNFRIGILLFWILRPMDDMSSPQPVDPMPPSRPVERRMVSNGRFVPTRLGMVVFIVSAEGVGSEYGRITGRARCSSPGDERRPRHAKGAALADRPSCLRDASA